LKDTPKALISIGKVKVTMSPGMNASPPNGLFVLPSPLGDEISAPPAVTIKLTVGSLRWYTTPFTNALLGMIVPEANSSHPSVTEGVLAIAALNASLLSKTMKSALAWPVRVKTKPVSVANLVVVWCSFGIVSLLPRSMMAVK
jgi:hypothetical protein